MTQNEVEKIQNEEAKLETEAVEEFNPEAAVLAETQKKESDGESNKYLHFKKGDKIKYINSEGKVEEISATEAHKRLEKILGTDNQRLMAKIAFIRINELEKIKSAAKAASVKTQSQKVEKKP